MYAVDGICTVNGIFRSMNKFSLSITGNRRLFLWAVSTALVLCCGCAPLIIYRSDTKIALDGTCLREVVIAGKPGRKLPNLRVKLRDYLKFPEAELYDKFVLTPDKALLQGRFKSPAVIPSDFVKLTPDSQLTARNRVLYRSVDLVLLRVIEYEERFSDIVDRGKGEAALTQLVNELMDVLLLAIDNYFSRDYDVSRLKTYLQANLPELARRLYASLWELRRAKRGGIRMLSESAEWGICLSRELQRLGYQPEVDPEQKSHASANSMFIDFLNQKLHELTAPLRKDVAPLDTSIFKSRGKRLKLLDILQETVKSRYGSLQTFSKKVQPLLVQTLGAFLIRQVSMMPVNPNVEFHARLVMPGHIVQTNGLCDVEGSILWSFSDREVALAGYGIWARSLLVNKKKLAAIGIENFPAHLYDVERLYQSMRDPKTHKLNKDVLAVLRQCLESGSLAALEEMAESGKQHAAAATGNAAIVAGNLLKLLKPFRDASTGKNQEPAPADSKKRKTSGDSRSAPEKVPPSASPAPSPTIHDVGPEPDD